VRHDVLDALDFLHGLDLGLQPCLMGCGVLYVGVSRFPQKIRSSLRPFSSARGCITKQAKRPSDLAGQSDPKQEINIDFQFQNPERPNSRHSEVSVPLPIPNSEVEYLHPNVVLCLIL
jgi:hypothetical protein